MALGSWSWKPSSKPKLAAFLQFIHGLRGELHVTWEEGTWAAWLYDLLQPQVQQVVVCNPRRNAFANPPVCAHPPCRSCCPPLICAPACCGRSTTEKTECGRCASWRVVIRRSAKI